MKGKADKFDSKKFEGGKKDLKMDTKEAKSKKNTSEKKGK